MDSSKKLGIVCATTIEAEPIINGLGLLKQDKGALTVFEHDRIILLVSGIGKVNAAIATTTLILTYEPEMIFNCGACGALDELHPLGTWYQIKRVIEHDRPLLRAPKPQEHVPHLLDGFTTAILSTQDHPVLTLEERIRIAADAGLADMEGAGVVQAAIKLSVKPVLFKFVSDTPHEGTSKDIIRNIKKYREPFAWFFIDEVLAAVGYKKL